MEYGKPVFELIKQRKSCRAYAPGKTDPAVLESLRLYIDGINAQSPRGIRFALVGGNIKDTAQPLKLGTYGIITGAEHFLAGAMKKGSSEEARFGYLFEKIVLHATDMGLGTYWLGGSFNRSDFGKSLRLGENEFIPIVSPVGAKSEKTRILDKVMRAGAGSDKRKPWNELFFENGISSPLADAAAGEYKTALEAVRLAPSASNKQPWRIIKDGGVFAFFLCRTKGYGIAAYDMQKNDIGIAMCHFELTAAEQGLKGIWSADFTAASPPDEWEFVSAWRCRPE